MRTLLLFFLLIGALRAADVNTTLYESSDKPALYKALRQQIDAAQAAGTLMPAQADAERTELERLRRAAAQTPGEEEDPSTLLSQTSPTLEQAYKALAAAATASVRQESAERKLRDIQSKLTFLKQTIEQLTAEEKFRLRAYQLQFAYYKVQQQNLEAKRDRLGAYGTAVAQTLAQRLKAIRCTGKDLRSEMQTAETEIEKSQQRRLAAEIALEGAELEESARSERLAADLKKANADYSGQLQTKLASAAKLALCMLITKENDAFFALLDTMEADAGRLTGDARSRFRAQNAQLRSLAKAHFGVTALVVGDTLHETKALLKRAGDTLTAPLFIFNERPISILSLLKALAILVAGFFLGAFYKRWITRLARRWPDMSQMSMRLASNIGYYLIVFVAVIIAMGSLGIDMTSISLIAGALSIGVGFGLQTVVSNFIAGIILMFERTIRIGDTIEISDVLRGRVTDMRIRSTTVKTFDNIDIVVPNSSFIQNNVINWTLEDATRRIHIPFGVAYGTEVDTVKKAVLEELKESSLSYLRHDPEKQPEVWMVNMNSSSVDFELIVWVEWANRNRPSALRSDFLILIYNALNKHGIQIPFPQLDLYVKQLPKDGL
ncbi:mechanosensitive ion channel [Sulfurimonas sp. HSL-3221]|uniref:mechanosensitive ion channel domain-containing protein n=1 Tax=Thiomicrolovo sulfuroxydans TaxID=2894755 RepID=UPI001E390D0D|nr:mechanosensitive ion channel domain-containing protein [Sulfurimonas sp. HSL-3221]UFS62559.1 mechanosensitive ion channel [Sulfurimonas sp. HSL-3221]